MEASSQPQPSSSDSLASRTPPREFTFEGPGVARLSLMVNTVLGALTAVDGPDIDSNLHPR